MNLDLDGRTAPTCRSCRQAIPIHVARVADEDGVVCVECLTFDNRLTESDRRFLRALHIGDGR